MSKIDTFRGKYAFLSNFYYAPIRHDGIWYPSTEHAFQACKTMDLDIRKEIANLEKPGQAKQMGKKVKLREDWEDVKINIMLQLVNNKFFSHPGLARKLLYTNSATLIEGNWWHDNFWGNCYCNKCQNKIGENNLGKVLMTVRSELVFYKDIENIKE